MAVYKNNLREIELCDDILQIIFSFSNWEKYTNLCNFYNIPFRINLYFQTMNPKLYPKLEHVCNTKFEQINLVKYLLNFISIYELNVIKNYTKIYSNKGLKKSLKNAFINSCKNEHKL